jgi:hypothetical protein
VAGTGTTVRAIPKARETKEKLTTAIKCRNHPKTPIVLQVFLESKHFED